MNQGAGSLSNSALVVALCPDADVFRRFAAGLRDTSLSVHDVRAAGIARALANIEGECQAEASTFPCSRLIPLKDSAAAADDVLHTDIDPVLEACFDQLATFPRGGAPWQGSWRGDVRDKVRKALEGGAIIVVAVPRSTGDQREWARVLLKSGCDFVHTHGTPPGSA